MPEIGQDVFCEEIDNLILFLFWVLCFQLFFSGFWWRFFAASLPLNYLADEPVLQAVCIIYHPQKDKDEGVLPIFRRCRFTVNVPGLLRAHCSLLSMMPFFLKPYRLPWPGEKYEYELRVGKEKENKRMTGDGYDGMKG